MSRRLIQPPDMKETCSIIFNYILLHFIEMYMSYLAACKPRITQRESGRKTREEKHRPKKKKKDPEIGITKREKKARHQTKTAACHPGPLSTDSRPLAAIKSRASQISCSLAPRRSPRWESADSTCFVRSLKTSEATGMVRGQGKEQEEITLAKPRAKGYPPPGTVPSSTGLLNPGYFLPFT